MFKIIRRIAFCFLIAVIILAGIQWKGYQKKSECRANALLYFKEEDYQKSIAYLEEAMDQVSIFGNEMDVDISCYLAESYYQLGNYEKAVDIYDDLISSDGKESRFYLLKAEAYEAMDKNEEAVSVLQKGWEKTKESTFLDKICDSYMKTDQYEQALLYAQKGVDAQNDQSASFLFKEVVIYEKCQDYQSAYEKASEYVNLYPDDEKGQKELEFLTTRIG